MALPLLDPLRDLTRTVIGSAGLRAASTCLTALLCLVAAGFFVAAGFAALMQVVGFPISALIFAALFAILALIAYLIGRQISVRQAARVLALQNQVKVDIALAAVLARTARPLLPIAAFLAAFAMGRRP